MDNAKWPKKIFYYNVLPQIEKREIEPKIVKRKNRSRNENMR